MQNPLEINASNDETSATVIWLHGLGSDGYDFEPIVKQLNLPQIRFILPHAPEMPVTRNLGYIMPAWYDVYGVTGNAREDEAGIRKTQQYIDDLIAREIERGIPSEKIAIAGFSQGGAIALQTALRYSKKLAGVLALSTYLPLKSSLETEATAENQHTPIFMAHGTHDDIISMDTCLASLTLLKNQLFSVDFHEYSMAHSVCTQEISDIRNFLQRIFL